MPLVMKVPGKQQVAGAHWCACVHCEDHTGLQAYRELLAMLWKQQKNVPTMARL